MGQGTYNQVAFSINTTAHLIKAQEVVLRMACKAKSHKPIGLPPGSGIDIEELVAE